MRTNPDFIRESKVVEIHIAQIRQLMKVPNSLDEIKGLVSSIDDKMRVMKENYTNKRWATEITIIDSASGQEMKIGVKDLKADLDGKTFPEILAEGRITINKDLGKVKA